jgi:hypothetical protein
MGKLLVALALLPALAWGAAPPDFPAKTLRWVAPTIDTNGGVPVIDHWVIAWTALASSIQQTSGSATLPASTLTFSLPPPHFANSSCGLWYFTIQSVTTVGAASPTSAPLAYDTRVACPPIVPVYPAVAVVNATLQ